MAFSNGIFKETLAHNLHSNATRKYISYFCYQITKQNLFNSFFCQRISDLFVSDSNPRGRWKTSWESTTISLDFYFGLLDFARHSGYKVPGKVSRFLVCQKEIETRVDSQFSYWISLKKLQTREFGNLSIVVLECSFDTSNTKAVGGFPVLLLTGIILCYLFTTRQYNQNFQLFFFKFPKCNQTHGRLPSVLVTVTHRRMPSQTWVEFKTQNRAFGFFEREGDCD